MKFIIAVLILLSSSILEAQPIFIHPDCHTVKTIYNSPAEWPTLDAQSQISFPGANSMNDIEEPGHNHGRFAYPTCGIITTPVFKIPFAIYLYDALAFVGPVSWDANFFFGPFVDSYETLSNQEFASRYPAQAAKWATATSDSFPLNGVNGALTVVVGELTVNLLRTGEFEPVPKNGWWYFSSEVSAKYVPSYSGGLTGNSIPFYSQLDITAPVTGLQGPRWVATSLYGAPNQTYSDGFAYAQVDQLLPCLIEACTPGSRTLEVAGFDYLGTDGVPGFIEIWIDRDLHHGIQGTLLHRSNIVAAPNVAVAEILFPPPGTSDGDHSVNLDWVSPSPDGSPIKLWTVLAYTAHVTNSIIPPPNVTWQVVPSTTQQEFIDGFPQPMIITTLSDGRTTGQVPIH